MPCYLDCRKVGRYLLWTFGSSWRTAFLTTSLCLTVPYLRVTLKAPYFQIFLFFLVVSFFRILGYCSERCYESTRCRPSRLISRMMLMLVCLGITVGSSFGFFGITSFLDVKNGASRQIIILMATLFYGLMGFSIEFGLQLGHKLENITSVKLLGDGLEEIVTFVGLALGFLEALLLFWIPINILDNLHLIMGLVGGIALIQMVAMFVSWWMHEGTAGLCEQTRRSHYAYACCEEMAHWLETVLLNLDVHACVISLLHLVFQAISSSLLIFAIDWHAQHESNSLGLSTNSYDTNDAFLSLSHMLLVPTVFLLVFPFVRNALSNCIHRFTFGWLIGLLGIGTFLSLFLCLLYLQQNLFNYAFLSIGITACLSPHTFDLVNYLGSVPIPRYDFFRYVWLPPSFELLEKEHYAFWRLFELLDLTGTSLGSIGSSLILEYYGYSAFLRVVTFSMGFVFVALCSLSLFKLRISCNETNQTTKDQHGSENNKDSPNEFEAKPYLYEIGTEPKVIFKRTVTKFV
jgi:hypothetical protein